MKNSSMNDDEAHILNTIRAQPELKNCFLEMIDITQDSADLLNCGDDAEEAIVESIRKTGEVLLQQWAQKKSDKAEEPLRRDPTHRPHIKKK
jgi:hypothetical protein